MKILVSTDAPKVHQTDLLILFRFQGEALDGTAKVLDRILGGQLTEISKAEQFVGKAGQTLHLRTHGPVGPKQVLLIGAGLSRRGPESARKAAAQAVRAAAQRGIRTAAIALPQVPGGTFEVAQAVTEGVLLGQYRFLRYKSKPEASRWPATLTLLTSSRLRRQVQTGIQRGLVFSEAVVIARDLGNEPASSMTPQALALQARRLAKQHPELRVKIFDQAGIRRLGMGALLGVARGSDEPPYFIHLSYEPARAKRSIALVGKGVTFDSGGLHIKPGKHMDTMKIDMAGAADILALFAVLPKLKPKLAVHGIIPTCENMPSGRATKPGDVLKALNGKTIEVQNTDAEGRLILADGLSYAVKLKPDALIDVATLTGSCLVALGEEIAGLMGTSPRLNRDFLKAARTTGEKYWELPLPEEYQGELESDVADLQNVGKSQYAGVLNGGLFLKEFTGGLPWIHLDIAGPAWAERETLPYAPKGSTGFSVRTLLQFVSGR